ncbi:MAG: DUF2058 domain-containing protein [Deltaproteobacteria bacterium]|nr:DUF2058 domain-containing protein [Deltaproteobacteria bacterium]
MNLKDQLLKAGLVDSKQARRATHQQRVKAKQQDRSLSENEEDAAAEEVRRQKEQQKIQDQALMARRNEERLAQENRLAEKAHRESEIAEVYRNGILANWEGPRRYNYLLGTRIESLMLSDLAAQKLEAGDAAIVAPRSGQGSPVVISASAAKKLREVAPEQVIVFFDS